MARIALVGGFGDLVVKLRGPLIRALRAAGHEVVVCVPAPSAEARPGVEAGLVYSTTMGLSPWFSVMGSDLPSANAGWPLRVQVKLPTAVTWKRTSARSGETTTPSQRALKGLPTGRKGETGWPPVTCSATRRATRVSDWSPTLSVRARPGAVAVEAPASAAARRQAPLSSWRSILTGDHLAHLPQPQQPNRRRKASHAARSATPTRTATSEPSRRAAGMER